MNPFNAVEAGSFAENVTTGPSADPLMIVAVASVKEVAPDVTMIAFPLKLRFSLYVPGETSTVSPFTAT